MPSNQKKRRRDFLQAVTVAVIIGFLAIAVYSYAQYREVLSLLPVVFKDSSGISETFYVEIASTPSMREKGLMFRKKMGEDRGMLFIFPKEETQRFWMKNTYLSLDMIFVNKELEVVGIVHNAPPLTEERQSVSEKSTYVIELNAGAAKASGIEKGDRVEFRGEIPKPI